ncbi:PhzA/PhzB family protein [Homoserinimonas sp. OAct 916]|uniref:PhzA/PhzB family protein n=1 Tax=Homoserinimonas sp. OAct 916 TaxID=2211450 RepID=UPI000DBE12C7|nr:PhzA/PhzB family protein [Homoserinimonas sp. OAct 916]
MGTTETRDINRAALYEWISRRWWDKEQHTLLPESGGTLRFVFAAEADEFEKDRNMAEQIDNLEDSYLNWFETPIEVFDTEDPSEFMVYFRHGYGQTASGEFHESEFLLLYRLEDGLVVHIDEYFQPLEIMKTLGRDVSPAVLLRDSSLPEPPFW